MKMRLSVSRALHFSLHNYFLLVELQYREKLIVRGVWCYREETFVLFSNSIPIVILIHYHYRSRTRPQSRSLVVFVTNKYISFPGTISCLTSLSRDSF